eukprot:6213070-Pleurochrysis_carterae.AAC.2
MTVRFVLCLPWTGNISLKSEFWTLTDRLARDLLSQAILANLKAFEVTPKGLLIFVWSLRYAY